MFYHINGVVTDIEPNLVVLECGGVGYALSHVDGEGLPCHRVVFADGSLARDAVFGGEGVQRRLLEAEGVPFLPDGRVDMEKCAL